MAGGRERERDRGGERERERVGRGEWRERGGCRERERGGGRERGERGGERERVGRGVGVGEMERGRERTWGGRWGGGGDRGLEEEEGVRGRDLELENLNSQEQLHQVSLGLSIASGGSGGRKGIRKKTQFETLNSILFIIWDCLMQTTMELHFRERLNLQITLRRKEAVLDCEQPNTTLFFLFFLVKRPQSSC